MKTADAKTLIVINFPCVDNRYDIKSIRSKYYYLIDTYFSFLLTFTDINIPEYINHIILAYLLYKYYECCGVCILKYLQSEAPFSAIDFLLSFKYPTQ